MEPSWAVVAGAVSAILVVLTGGVPFFNMVAGGIEKWRKSKAEQKAVHDSQTIEGRRLDSDGRDKAIEAVWKIVEERNQECKRLNEVIDELQQNHSLPRPLMTQIYEKARKIGTQIENIKFLLKNNASKIDLEKEVEILEQLFDGLDKILP